MTIEAQVKQILALVNAQTAALASLTEAVGNLHGGAGADLTPINAALATLNAGVADLQSQLETDGAPAPAAANADAASSDAGQATS